MRPNRSAPVWLATLLVALVIAACGGKRPVVMPPLPATLAHPEFVFPTVPGAAATSPEAIAMDRGWRFLQNDDLASADREFAALLKRRPALAPALAGAGYVQLARRNYREALGLFDRALMPSTEYAPALVGKGEALLSLDQAAEALPVLESALALDPSLTIIRERVDVLRFRSAQETLDLARQAAAAGRLAEARTAYARAIAGSPESAFLYRELGLVEQRDGSLPEALEHLQRAVALDESDGASWLAIADILESQGDLDGALTALGRARMIEPSAELDARATALAAKAREARLPAQVRAIPTAMQVTRGDLAALIGVRLEAFLRAAPGRSQVTTDTRGHWAAAWIAQVVRVGVLKPFDNHTFQPNARLRRVDLAEAVSAVVGVAARERADLQPLLRQRPTVADVPPRHLQYRAVATAVASGVMTLAPGNRFQMTRVVSGAEAADVVARLAALVQPAR